MTAIAGLGMVVMLAAVDCLNRASDPLNHKPAQQVAAPLAAYAYQPGVDGRLADYSAIGQINAESLKP